MTSRKQQTISKRHPLDFYETPREAIEVLIQQMPFGRGATYFHGSVLEPCVGDGAIAKPLAAAGYMVATNDLNPERSADWHKDASKPGFWRDMASCKPEFVITNPPFTRAAEIASYAVKMATSGVALFLRLTFLEPTLDRADWLVANPPRRMIVLPRYSFTADGKTDSVTAAWICWGDCWEPGFDFVSRTDMARLKKAGYLPLLS